MQNILVVDYNENRRKHLMGLIEGHFKQFKVYSLVTQPPGGATDHRKLAEIKTRRYALMIGHIGGNPSGAQCLNAFKEHNPGGRAILYTKQNAIDLKDFVFLKRANKLFRRSDNDEIAFDDENKMLTDLKEVLDEKAIDYVGEGADIIVLTALREELDYLLGSRSIEWTGDETYDKITYDIGRTHEGLTIAAASANAAGMSSAAINATAALRKWRPRLAVMIGICAGMKQKVSLGDIVVADKAFAYQFGAFKAGQIQRELQVKEPTKVLLDLARNLQRDDGLITQIRASSQRGAVKPRHSLRCHIGPMATADLVVKDTDKIAEAVEAERKTIALDMESYAFLQAAELAGTTNYLVIKSVTDFADPKKNDKFREYAKFTSTEFFLRLLEKFAPRLGYN